MDVELQLLRHREQVEQLVWCFFQLHFRCEIQPPVGEYQVRRQQVRDIAREGRLRYTQVFLLQDGAENPRQVAHLAGEIEVARHELLGPRLRAGAEEAHAPGNLRLQVEAQPLLRPCPQQVHIGPHGGKETIGLRVISPLVAAQQIVAHQRLRLLQPVAIARQPGQRLQVAQTALALFHIRLEQEARVTPLGMAGIALAQFILSELARFEPHHFTLDGFFQCQIFFTVAAHQPRIHQAGGDGMVVLRRFHRPRDAAHRMADRNLHVP